MKFSPSGKRHRFQTGIRKWLLRGIPFSLALLSILLSIESDVFHQHPSPMTSLWTEPWEAFERHEAVPLSELLQGVQRPPGSIVPRMGALDAPERAPLYVFALDVSGSMKGRELWEREIRDYERLMKPEKGGSYALECLRAKGDRADQEKVALAYSGDLALAELCRYLGSIPVPSRVALWTFGEKPQQVVPEPRPKWDKYIEVEQAEGGGPPAHAFLQWVHEQRDQVQAQSLTDIEVLFIHLSEEYAAEIKGDDEVHFVVVSDFIHDVDGKLADSKAQNGVSSLEWEGYYLSSRGVIGEHVARLVGNGVTLHLAVIQGGNSSLRNVLPVLRGQAEWGDIREANLGSGRRVAAFDFLRSYQQAGELRFRFTSGQSKPTPRSIWLDHGNFEGSTIRLGLATDPLNWNAEEFRVRVSSERDGPRTRDHYLGNLKADDGEYVREILRAGEDGGDRLLLEPSTILSARQAASYRLLVSLDDRNGKSGEEAVCCTFSVPIVFHQDLSRPSAAAILFSYLALLLSLAGCIVTWGIPTGVRLISGAYRRLPSRLQRDTDRRVEEV